MALTLDKDSDRVCKASRIFVCLPSLLLSRAPPRLGLLCREVSSTLPLCGAVDPPGTRVEVLPEPSLPSCPRGLSYCPLR